MNCDDYNSHHHGYYLPVGKRGPRGPKGPTGPAGRDGCDTGIVGATGAPGPTGPNGVSSYIIPGNGNPVNAPSPNSNNLFVDSSTGNIWFSTGQLWTLAGNIRGPQGSTGPTGPTGNTGPIGLQGIPPGIFSGLNSPSFIPPTRQALYIQSTNGGIYHFVDGIWHFIADFTGPQGVTGPIGPSGPRGKQGEIGSLIYTGTTPPCISPCEGSNHLYLDTCSGTVYQWLNCAWSSVGNLKGPRGRDGPQGPRGDSGPRGDIGCPGTTAIIPSCPPSCQSCPNTITVECESKSPKCKSKCGCEPKCKSKCKVTSTTTCPPPCPQPYYPIVTIPSVSAASGCGSCKDKKETIQSTLQNCGCSNKQKSKCSPCDDNDSDGDSPDVNVGCNDGCDSPLYISVPTKCSPKRTECIPYPQVFSLQNPVVSNGANTIISAFSLRAQRTGATSVTLSVYGTYNWNGTPIDGFGNPRFTIGLQTQVSNLGGTGVTTTNYVVNDFGIADVTYEWSRTFVISTFMECGVVYTFTPFITTSENIIVNINPVANQFATLTVA